MVDSISNDSVSEQDPSTDQGAESGGKKTVTAGQYRTLEGAGMDMSGYQVAPTSPDVPPEGGDPANADDTLANEGGATTPPADDTPTDSVPDPATPPSGDAEKAGEDGWTIQSLGVVTTRMHKESGKVEFKVKINGVEEWVSDVAYNRGYQRNIANSRESEKLAAERQAFNTEREATKNFESILTDLSKPLPNNPAVSEFDDILTPSAPSAPAAPPANEAVSERMNRIEAENLALRRELGATPEQKAAVELQKQTYAEMDASWNEARAFCKEAKIPLQTEEGGYPTEAFLARVGAVAETEGINPATIMRSPARVIGVIKGMYKKTTPASKPSADSTDTPPTALAPQRGTPGLGELQKANKEQEAWKKKSKDPKSDDRDVTVGLIRNLRKRKALAKK